MLDFIFTIFYSLVAFIDETFQLAIEYLIPLLAHFVDSVLLLLDELYILILRCIPANFSIEYVPFLTVFIAYLKTIFLYKCGYFFPYLVAGEPKIPMEDANVKATPLGWSLFICSIVLVIAVQTLGGNQQTVDLIESLIENAGDFSDGAEKSFPDSQNTVEPVIAPSDADEVKDVVETTTPKQTSVSPLENNSIVENSNNPVSVIQEESHSGNATVNLNINTEANNIELTESTQNNLSPVNNSVSIPNEMSNIGTELSDSGSDSGSESSTPLSSVSSDASSLTRSEAADIPEMLEKCQQEGNTIGARRLKKLLIKYQDRFN